jgi:hypothetical protein
MELQNLHKLIPDISALIGHTKMPKEQVYTLFCCNFLWPFDKVALAFI